MTVKCMLGLSAGAGVDIWILACAYMYSAVYILKGCMYGKSYAAVTASTSLPVWLLVRPVQ